MTVYISIIFTEDQEKMVRDAMKKYDVSWPDLVKMDNPDYFHWPFQVRLVFEPRADRGDDNYADWREGDLFVDEDDPQGRGFLAIKVDPDYQTVTFIDPEQGEVLAQFANIRRVGKGKRHA